MRAGEVRLSAAFAPSRPRRRFRGKGTTERGGRTAVRSTSFPPLRAWQRKALVEYLRRRTDDFLAVATPGAGKTTFALRIAAELLADGTVDAVTVVAPTEHLKTQWASAAARVGIELDAAFRNADLHSVGRLPRRRRHLRPGGHGAARCTAGAR